MNILITILLTVLMFSVIIFVHELGHFITAKLFKVRVNEFALGMGPKILSKKYGETEYSLRLVPIGGFVSMEGEQEDSDDERSFNKIKVWKRIIICSAGVFMNFVLGLIVAVSLVATSSSPYLKSTTIAQVKINESENKLMAGDKILSVSGYKVFVGNDIVFGITRSDPTGKSELIELETDFVVLRDGKKVTLENVRPYVRVTDEQGKKEDVVSFLVYPQEKNFISVLSHGFFEAVSYIRTTYLGLFDLITGRVGVEGLGGIVKVGQVVGKTSKYGVDSFLRLAAMISVNIGVMNLLPIPALDGGRILLLAVEGVFRKPLNSKIEEALIAVSMILLFGLMIFVTIKDIVSIF